MELTKESSISILIRSVEIAQTKGCFLLQEASLLKKAIDSFDKNAKTKPDFGTTEDPEIVAINLLLQGVQKAQNYKECPFSLGDASILYDTFKFLSENVGKGVDQNVNLGGSSSATKKDKKSAVTSLQSIPETQDDDEDDDEDEIKPIVSSKKGKKPAE
jgi:hypothetical protein